MSYISRLAAQFIMRGEKGALGGDLMPFLDM
jgi:hypothetical protein